MIYTDLEKAFDKVFHKKLISKLWYYNFHPDIIKWISSFYRATRMHSAYMPWHDVRPSVRLSVTRRYCV